MSSPSEPDVIEETIAVETDRGRMPVHLARPEGTGPFPLVVLYMDAPGIRPALHDHARRLVHAGYRTALPDLYYGLEPGERPRPERLSAGHADERERMMAAVVKLRDAEVLDDTAALLEQLGTGAAQWGCLGFCAGGRFGLRAAGRFGEQLAAAALIHPSRLVTDEPDSPHRRLDGASAELYLAFGESDHVTPLSVIPPLREQLEQHSIVHRIEVIPHGEHGFAMPGLPAYNQQAAERASAGTLGLLAERLG